MQTYLTCTCNKYAFIHKQACIQVHTTDRRLPTPSTNGEAVASRIFLALLYKACPSWLGPPTGPRPGRPKSCNGEPGRLQLLDWVQPSLARSLDCAGPGHGAVPLQQILVSTAKLYRERAQEERCWTVGTCWGEAAPPHSSASLEVP